MNISLDRLESNSGDGLEERPEYVDDALRYRRRLAEYGEGLPLSVPDSEIPDLGLGDEAELRKLYRDHYPSEDSELLKPDARPLCKLVLASEHVESLADAAAELGVSKSTVETAAKLHGLDVSPSPEPSETEGGGGLMQLRLPSGETIPLDSALGGDPLHPLVLAQLMSDGLSLEEIRLYLRREGFDVDSSAVREAARDAGYIGDSPTVGLTVERRTPSSGKTVKSGDSYDHEPW